jgi:hypothetical protein
MQAALYATATLTLNSEPGNTETVSIGRINGTDVFGGSRVYTFDTTGGGGMPANTVYTGGSAANAAINLRKAINDNGTEGTDYGTGTAIHEAVSADDDGAGVVTIRSKIPGRWGDFVNLSETLSDGSSVWSGSTMSTGKTPNFSTGCLGQTGSQSVMFYAYEDNYEAQNEDSDWTPGGGGTASCSTARCACSCSTLSISRPTGRGAGQGSWTTRPSEGRGSGTRSTTTST